MKGQQHYEVTLTSAIAHYQKGDLTAKGLLLFYLKIRLKQGWVLKETQKEITDKLGISRAAFYSALSKLKAEGSINWSTPANTKFSISLNSSLSTDEDDQSTIQDDQSTIQDDQSTIQDDQSTIQDDQSTIQDDQSTIQDDQSTIQDDQSTIQDDQSTIVDSTSFIVTGEKTEANQGKGLGNSSYSSSSFSSNFLSTFLSSLSSERERETFENFCLEAASRMPTQPILVSLWIEKNAQTLAAEYKLRVLDRKIILKDEFDYEVNSSLGKCSANPPTVENKQVIDW